MHLFSLSRTLLTLWKKLCVSTRAGRVAAARVSMHRDSALALQRESARHSSESPLALQRENPRHSTAFAEAASRRPSSARTHRRARVSNWEPQTLAYASYRMMDHAARHDAGIVPTSVVRAPGSARC